jgi:transcriptional regulator of acetoin/glycerol metabolism
MPSSHDVIIIGTGPEGIFAAIELVKSSSLKVLLIEKGGDIQQRSCPMPNQIFPAYSAAPAASCAAGVGRAETLMLIERAASSDSPVLIIGVFGAGKNLVAKSIHYMSKADEAPFISINCASLPEYLIEASLFVFEKGAFTGAMNAKQDLFELAET